MKLQRLISFSSFLVFILILPESRAGSSSAPVHIEMPVFEGGEGISFFKWCARAFEQAMEQRGRSVSVDLTGDPRMPDKVRIRIFEGSYPEVTNVDLDWWRLIRRGRVLSLDPYLDGPPWNPAEAVTWRDTFLPGTLAPRSYRGKTYGVPFAFFIWSIWYNRDLFENHAFDIPKTWDELYRLCARIHELNIIPMAYQGRYPNYGLSMVYSNYYHLAGPEKYRAWRNMEPGTFDTRLTVRSLELFRELAGTYMQPGVRGMSHTEAQMQFFSGKSAMIPCGSWLKSEMMGRIPEGFRMGSFSYPLPGSSMGDPTAVYSSSSYYHVFSKSANPEAAVDFLRFMTSREVASEFCRQRDITVAIHGANKGNLSQDMTDLERILQGAGSVIGEPPGGGVPEMLQYLQDGFLRVLDGSATPEGVATRWEEQARQIRDRQRNPDRVHVKHRGKALLLLFVIAILPLVFLVHYLVRILRRRRDSQDPDLVLPRLSWGNVTLFIAPALVVYAVFVLWPALRSFGWSLHQWDGLGPMEYKGLLNFRRLLLENDGFWVALGNNLFIMLVIPLFVIPLSLFLAACISGRIRGSRLFRVIFFFPNILGGVAAALLWMHFYNPDIGPVNKLLGWLSSGFLWMGLETPAQWLDFRGFAWLAQDSLYRALIPMFVWGGCGFNMVLFLAAMESIPRELYEAADLDGVGPWAKFCSITLPMIREVLLIAIVFMVIGGMKVFDTIWIWTNQRPMTQTHVISTRMVQTMFQEFRVGEATALAVLLFAMAFAGSLLAIRIGQRPEIEHRDP